MPIRQPNQSRYLTAALGDRNTKLTVAAVWLTAIAIAVLLVLVISAPKLLNNSVLVPAGFASADYTDQNQITSAQFKTIAAEGKTIFVSRCQSCHASGGKVAGVGPQLNRVFNARDASYIHTTVRWGIAGINNQPGMPVFTNQAQPTDPNLDPILTAITDDELYKVIVYLRTVQIYPRGYLP